MSEREPRWAKKPPQKCGTCKWLRPRSDGKPFWHGGSYKCTWIFPSDFKWPDSVDYRAHGSPIPKLQERPGSYMQPREGVECPCWEQAAPNDGKPVVQEASAEPKA